MHSNILNTLMQKLRTIRASGFVATVTVFVLIASIFFFRDARSLIDRPFNGFLTLQNNMVGAFSGLDWPGYKSGLRYHDIIEKVAPGDYSVTRADESFKMRIDGGIFSLKDFLVVFFAPFASGIFYLISAIIIFIVGRNMRGIVPFFLFNAGIAYYFIASFDFHTSHHAGFLFLLVFACLPAFMSHFALVFPEEPRVLRNHKWLIALPYLLTLVVYVPYVYTFYSIPNLWGDWETIVVAYASLSYVFWIAMLMRNARAAARKADRTAASYLLLGQLLAFIVPLTAAVAIFIFRRNISLNIIAPVTVVLPVASLFGLVLGNLKNTQLKLVQSEKMASLGNLVAGVAHEINNPTTFIYSNLPMLREYVSYLKSAVRSDAKPFRGQMSAEEVIDDMGALVGTISEGADRIKSIVSDLRRFGHSQDEVIQKVEIRAGIESTINLLAHEVKDRIAIHLDVPEGLVIDANAGQINQVWMNILANAAQSIGDSGNIWIAGHKTDDKVLVEVRDDGKGMPASVLDRIFDPFFTTKPEGQGTGMGLAICQQIVHRWKGDIVINSEEGKGTTVQVMFRG